MLFLLGVAVIVVCLLLLRTQGVEFAELKTWIFRIGFACSLAALVSSLWTMRPVLSITFSAALAWVVWFILILLLVFLLLGPRGVVSLIGG